MKPVFRARYSKPVPPHARRFVKGGKDWVRWDGRTGPIEGVLSADGGRVTVTVTDTWYVRWVDEHGRERTRKGFPDKAASEALARQLQTSADRVRAGIELPAATRGRSLDDHLADYVADQRHRGRSANHVTTTRHMLGVVLGRTLAESPAQLTPAAVRAAVADERAVRKFGPTTANRYVRAVRTFLAWLVREGRSAANPLADVEYLDERASKKKRRSLTEAEFGRLLLVARASRPRKRRADNHPFGTDREVLYLVAGSTGLRAHELAVLTPARFRLDGSPGVWASADAAKNKTEDVLPLPAKVAERVRNYLDGRPPAARVWPGMWYRRAAELLARDLAAAGIAPVDDRGRQVVFHSLRRTYISRLIRSGADVKTVQSLARHSTITLTMDIYAETDEDARRSAVDRLPDVG